LADLVGCLAGGVLHLIGKSAYGFLGLIRDLACLIGNLTSGVLYLPRGLTRRLLRLTGHLLRLLGRHVGRALA